MRAASIIFISLLLCAPATAQVFDALHPPNTYRNADNPHYWKNRPPYDGYWQQDVHYRIDARLDDRLDQVTADMTLTYHNNSPDTLHEVFFHLYQEAYAPGSYLASQWKDRGWMRGSDADAPYAGTRVEELRVNDVPLTLEQDNTVLRATLNEPLAPGEKCVFKGSFTTHWQNGLQRRMKLFTVNGQKHYDGVHWYPRIAVYDAYAGWDTQQHLGSEFYGDFGTFDVSLDMPADQIVEATGWLQNEAEVLPDSLLRLLDIANFADKPWNSAASVLIPNDPETRKVWRYHAENVHDFAWTCDPTYRIGTAEWNGVKCVAVVQEPHAAKWQNAASYAAKVIETFSTDFGMYAYPKMVVADARDGMEYPMLTLDSGNEPNYRGLFVHEIGHNWFFGMLGNNETYRAFMDEGFTQFLTVWGLERIDGDTLVTEPSDNAYVRRHTRPTIVREDDLYLPYQRDAVRDELPPINTQSDDFDHVAGRGYGYSHVYFKTGTMLYNLQYVLGDSLFQEAMRHYVDQWRMCHPYPQDFRNSIIRHTKVDLNWFFDQWIETDKRIDYAVRKVRHRFASAGQEIHLRRIGPMQMPLDLRITARDGSEHDLHIPNTWFVKKTDATVLPKWISYGDLQRDRIVKVDIPTGIKNVEIDPSGRLADANPLNNSLEFPMTVTFDSHVYNRPYRRKYEAFLRPDVWYNGYDGVKAGFHVNSSYMRYKHKVHFSAWLNTGFGQNLPEGGIDTRYDAFSYNFRYENNTERLLKGSSFFVKARHLDGMELYGGGFAWATPDERFSVSSDIRYLIRRDTSDLTYLLYPQEWSLNSWSGVMDIFVDHQYRTSGEQGRVQLRLRQPLVGSVGFGENVRLTSWNTFPLGRASLRLHGIAQYGTGTGGIETAFYMAGAAPENLVEDKYVRSIGFVPYDWVGAYGADLSNFHQAGGLNLRGYAGYLAPERAPNGEIVYTYRGNTGAAINAELDLDGLVRWRPRAIARTLHLDAYLFGDVGTIGYRYSNSEGVVRLAMALPRADAGVGLALSVKRWGPLSGLEPFTLRFDMPLLLSSLPATETDHFAFRYVVGVGRTF